MFGLLLIALVAILSLMLGPVVIDVVLLLLVGFLTYITAVVTVKPFYVEKESLPKKDKMIFVWISCICLLLLWGYLIKPILMEIWEPLL